MTADTTGLEKLEQTVYEAAKRLRQLRKENRHLQQKVEQLERGLPRSHAEPGDWTAERREIRRRVEKLAGGLEKLLRST